MNESLAKNDGPPKAFDLFLLDLRQQEDAAWIWLLDHFREKVVPYIRKRDGRLPKDTIVSVDYFIEEVFANSLIKFYELFEKGEFADLGQLRGLMFRIAELKLKEGYKKVKKDKALFFSDDATSESSSPFEENEASLEQEEKQVVSQLQTALQELSESDRQVLLRFANGDQLKIIAAELEINEVSCRKKKQRALEKMRKLLKPLIH